MLGQHITFWLDREKSDISHEKLQKWIGREGEFSIREVEFMKINDYRIILIGKGNKLHSVLIVFLIKKFCRRMLPLEFCGHLFTQRN